MLKAAVGNKCSAATATVFSLRRRQPSHCSYRLCVLASGSLITDIFCCFTLISVSCLHFGQNNGKFSSTVSLRIFTRVLLPQVGHRSHAPSSVIATPPMPPYSKGSQFPVALIKIDTSLVHTFKLYLGFINFNCD